MSNARARHSHRLPLAPPALAATSALAALAVVAALALVFPTSRAAADDETSLRSRHVVATSAILTGPRWYFWSTARDHVGHAQGSAVAVIYGRDIFTADGRSAVTLEAYAGTAIGGRGRSAHAGGSIGVKARTARRLELSASFAIVDHVDPSRLRKLTVGGGAIAQLSYDLDDARPFSTRILLRAELQHPTPTIVTLDTFVGLGTRWP